MSLLKDPSALMGKISQLFDSRNAEKPDFSYDNILNTDNDLKHNLNELAKIYRVTDDGTPLDLSEILNYVMTVNDTSLNDASSHDVLAELDIPSNYSTSSQPRR